MKFWLHLSLVFMCLSVGILALRLADAVSTVSSESVRDLAQVTKDADDLKKMTNATLFQVGDASHEVADMAREQKGYWKQSAEQTTAALTKANQVLDQLRMTIQNVDTSQAAIAGSATDSLKTIGVTADSLNTTVAKAGAAVDSMNRVIQDPAIPETLARVNETAAHLDSMSSSLDVAVKRWTKPKALWKSLLVGGLDSASKVAILAK